MEALQAIPDAAPLSPVRWHAPGALGRRDQNRPDTTHSAEAKEMTDLALEKPEEVVGEPSNRDTK